MRTPIALVLILCSALPVAADVYRWVGEDGQVNYSDRPGPGAELLRASAASLRAGSEPATEPRSIPAGDAGPYDDFRIVAPEDGAVLMVGDGQVDVSLLLIPRLADGHGLELLVNGAPVQGERIGTQLTLRGLPLGSHSVQARIRDDENLIIAATQVAQFHLRATPSEDEFAER